MLSNQEKTESAQRRLGMKRKRITSDRTIVEHADMLSDLHDLCLAAGLHDMAEIAYKLWSDVALDYRAELTGAEARWT